MRYVLVVFIFLLQIFSEKVAAQQHYFFTNYTVDEGLSGNAVNCIIKDRDGYLWIGTESGLNRFNGYDFVNYKSLAGDSTTIPSNSIHGFLIDHNGTLWIATGWGVCSFNKNANNFKRYYFRQADGRKNFTLEFINLFQDSRRNIWAATVGNGLLKYNTSSEIFESAHQLFMEDNKNQTMSITEDVDSTLWIMGYNYLFHYNSVTNEIKAYDNRIKAENNAVFQGMKVINDRTDSRFLWVGSWGNGLLHFNEQNGEFVSYKFEPSISRNLCNIVFNIHQYSKNSLWLATNKGVLVFDTEIKKFTCTISDPLNSRVIVNTEALDIYGDPEDGTWIGTIAGLCNIHPAKQYFVNEVVWPKPPVQKYLVDDGGNKIYGVRFYSNRALVIYDRIQNKEAEYKIPQADEFRAEPFAVIKDNDGLIWIGTTRGIYTFNEATKKFALLEMGKRIGIPDRSVYVGDAYKARNGNLWFSCYGRGLLMVDSKTKEFIPFFYNENNKNNVPPFSIISIAEGPDSSIYGCYEAHGIIKISCDKKISWWINTSDAEYSWMTRATDMVITKDGNLWVTTRNSGLICIDKNKSTTAFIKDEFGNIIDEQENMIADDSGKIWLTASNGIYRFDTDLKSFMHFTMQDGFPARTVSGPLIRLKNGKISFLILNGVFCFDPFNVSKAIKPLNVHFTSFGINGKDSPFSHGIDFVDTIRLNHNENNLTFEFAATNFNNPVSTLYSFRLDGADNNWSAETRTRTVNFSQLSPGNYNLRIRTGEHSPEKKILIQIIPAWWQTSWFHWLIAVAVVILLFSSIRFFYSIRYKQKIATLERHREIEQIRMRISRDIHDEIGSGLTKIKLISRNLLRKEKGDQSWKEATSKISNASEELIQNLGEIVWTINPENDTLENIFAFVRNYVSRLFDENSGIKLNLDFTEYSKIPQGVNINPEIKRNLLLILKESFTNVIKHSLATEIFISMHAEKSEIKITVKDNGVGLMSPSPLKSPGVVFGNGINNMQKRAESMNAIFYFDSKSDGTIVQLIIPLNTEIKIPT